MIRLVTTRRLRRLQTVIDAHWRTISELDKQIADLKRERAADSIEGNRLTARIRVLVDERDRYKAAWQSAEAGATAGYLGGQAMAEALQASAAAADLPIGLDVTADDWHLAVKAAIADIAARKKAEAIA